MMGSGLLLSLLLGEDEIVLPLGELLGVGLALVSAR